MNSLFSCHRRLTFRGAALNHCFNCSMRQSSWEYDAHTCTIHERQRLPIRLAGTDGVSLHTRCMPKILVLVCLHARTHACTHARTHKCMTPPPPPQKNFSCARSLHPPNRHVYRHAYRHAYIGFFNAIFRAARAALAPCDPSTR